LEVEVRVPRHGGDGAQEEGGAVVEEAGMPRILERAQSAARHRTAPDRQGLHPGPAQISLQGGAAMPRTQKSRVVSGGHMLCVPASSLPGLTRQSINLRKKLIAKKMDARVISAFTRVFNALVPAHDRLDDYSFVLECITPRSDAVRCRCAKPRRGR